MFLLKVFHLTTHGFDLVYQILKLWVLGLFVCCFGCVVRFMMAGVFRRFGWIVFHGFSLVLLGT